MSQSAHGEGRHNAPESFQAWMEDNGRVHTGYLDINAAACRFVGCSPEGQETEISTPIPSISSVMPFLSTGVHIETSTDELRLHVPFSRERVLFLINSYMLYHSASHSTNAISESFANVKEPSGMGMERWVMRWCVLTPTVLSTHNAQGEAPVRTLSLERVYDVRVEKEEGMREGGEWSVVVRGVDHATWVIGFNSNEPASQWADSIRDAASKASRVVNLLCFSSLTLSGDKAVDKVWVLNFYTHSFLQLVGASVQRSLGFHHLFGVQTGSHNAINLIWSPESKQRPDVVYLPTDKERQLWLQVLQAIVAFKHEARLVGDVAEGLGPVVVGFAKVQGVMGIWTTKWLELCPYGELVVFGECPRLQPELSKPLQCLRITGSRVFNEGDNYGLQIAFPYSVTPLHLRFDNRTERDTWVRSLIQLSSERLHSTPLLDACLRATTMETFADTIAAWRTQEGAAHGGVVGGKGGGDDDESSEEDAVVLALPTSRTLQRSELRDGDGVEHPSHYLLRKALLSVVSKQTAREGQQGGGGGWRLATRARTPGSGPHHGYGSYIVISKRDDGDEGDDGEGEESEGEGSSSGSGGGGGGGEKVLLPGPGEVRNGRPLWGLGGGAGAAGSRKQRMVVSLNEAPGLHSPSPSANPNPGVEGKAGDNDGCFKAPQRRTARRRGDSVEREQDYLENGYERGLWELPRSRAPPGAGHKREDAERKPPSTTPRAPWLSHSGEWEEGSDIWHGAEVFVGAPRPVPSDRRDGGGRGGANSSNGRNGSGGGGGGDGGDEKGEQQEISDDEDESGEQRRRRLGRRLFRSFSPIPSSPFRSPRLRATLSRVGFAPPTPPQQHASSPSPTPAPLVSPQPHEPNHVHGQHPQGEEPVAASRGRDARHEHRAVALQAIVERRRERELGEALAAWRQRTKEISRARKREARSENGQASGQGQRARFAESDMVVAREGQSAEQARGVLPARERRGKEARQEGAEQSEEGESVVVGKRGHGTEREGKARAHQGDASRQPSGAHDGASPRQRVLGGLRGIRRGNRPTSPRAQEEGTRGEGAVAVARTPLNVQAFGFLKGEWLLVKHVDNAARGGLVGEFRGRATFTVVSERLLLCRESGEIVEEGGGTPIPEMRALVFDCRSWPVSVCHVDDAEELDLTNVFMKIPIHTSGGQSFIHSHDRHVYKGMAVTVSPDCFEWSYRVTGPKQQGSVRQVYTRCLPPLSDQ